MSPRIDRNNVYKLQPALVTALSSLGEAAGRVIDAPLVHLLHLRISQLNGCAFCQHMHAAEARRDGEQQQRLDVLAAWQETHFFLCPRARGTALGRSADLTGRATGI